jgi:hypothetical protein
MFERLEEGLNTKIGAENKGYQLMLKMGYIEGGKVGKKNSEGLLEPIKVEIKKGKQGIEYIDKDLARKNERK